MPDPASENMAIRPYIRMAARWLGLGYTEEQILNWAQYSRNYYNVAYMREAIPEAKRSLYFAARIREADPNMRLSTLWGWYARGTWYAGYGRAPTAAEREWAYRRPSDMVGLMFYVSGRTERTNTLRSFPVTINVPWNATMADIDRYVRDQIIEGHGVPADVEYDPLQPYTIQLSLVGGALIERQATTFVMPGI